MGGARSAAAWIAALALVSSCSDAASPDPAATAARATATGRTTPAAEAIVLVTIDGVRWQEVFGGVDARLAEAARLPRAAITGARELMPNAHRLFFEGGAVLGDPRLGGGIAASGPRYVSLPGYVEIMTGAPGACTTNECEPELARTLAEDVAAGGARVAVFGSWDKIGRLSATDPKGIAIGAGRDASDEEPPWPGFGTYRPDRVTSARAVAHLLEHRPRLLWIALGDTDEWAHRGDYRGYLDALRAAAALLGELAEHLDEMGEYGRRAALLVTTDHGRDPAFHDHGGAASSAVWLLARGAGVARRGSTGTAAKRYLRDLAPTARALLGLPARSCDGCGQPIPEILGGYEAAAIR